MKNFPHQFSDPAKLVGTLAAIVDLEGTGADALDDGTLGYELARRGIYRFRGLEYGEPRLEERLAARMTEERAKPPGSQGARTAARDVRRSLILLDLLTEELEITALGAELLDAPPGSDREHQVWQAALINLRLESQAGLVSHPIRILLDLARTRPFDRRIGTELALEAEDDSEAEAARVRVLASLPPGEMEEQLFANGATANKIENARKILPALAVHAGLLTADAQQRVRVTATGLALLDGAYELGPMETEPIDGAGPRIRRLRQPRRVNAETAGRDRTAGDRRAMTPEEQAEAARLLAERTDRHQALVRRLAANGRTAVLYEDPASYDLVMVPAIGAIVLWEAKTINNDGDSQVRSAVGQLFFYRHFRVAPQWPDREVLLALVIDQPIEQGLLDFLTEMGIGALLLDTELVGLNALGEEIAVLLRQLDEYGQRRAPTHY